MTNKRFWSMIKPFLKGYINGEETILKCDNETVTESSVLVRCSTHMTNIVEKTSGKRRVILLLAKTFLILDKL